MSPSQVHATGPPLPRLPELYLQAGAALLMARRPPDCMALCDEVITTTLELLPEKLVMEEPEEKCEAKTRALCAEGEDGVGMLLWAGAAYLLQGHCHAHLKNWKQAVTHYTRSVNKIGSISVITLWHYKHKILLRTLQVFQPAGEGAL